MNSNIYEKYGGSVDLATMEACWEALRSHLAEMRKALDDRAFPLHLYTRAVLDSIVDAIQATDAGDLGFVEGMGSLYRVVKHIRDNNDPEAEQLPFYPVAKAYDEQHRLPRTNGYISRMVPGLFHQYLRFAVEEFEAYCADKLREAIRDTRLAEKRERLVDLAGEESVARLDDLLLQHQLSLSPTRVFVQGMLDAMTMSLLSVFELTGEVPI